jgi:hypothetical protein
MARKRNKGKKEDRRKRKSGTEEARRPLLEMGAKKNQSDSFGSAEFRPLLNRQNKSLFSPSLTITMMTSSSKTKTDHEIARLMRS